jgi:uncharacterized protein YegP (UPF0339 family)
MAGKFVLKRAKNNDFYFSLVAGNGEILGRSEMYRSRASALNGVDSVKRNAPIATHFLVREGRDGQHYLSLKASNGQVILSGDGYSSHTAARKGGEAIGRATLEARLIDETLPQPAT